MLMSNSSISVLWRLTVCQVLLLVGFAHADRAVTIAEPSIPLPELALRLKPLTVDQLWIEADAWMGLLTTKVDEVSTAEIAVFRKNQTIEEAQRALDSVEEAREQLGDARQALVNMGKGGNAAATEDAQQAVAESEQKLGEAATAVDQLIAVSGQLAQSNTVRESLNGAASARDEAEDMRASLAMAEQATATVAEQISAGGTQAESAAEGSETVTDSANLTAQDPLAAAADAAKAVVAEQSADKAIILETLNEQRTERTELIDRLAAVLDELNTKLGTPADADDHESVRPYRLYADAVSGITVDVTDTHAAWSTVQGWLMSPEGGVRWAENIGLFLLSVTSFWLLGKVLGRAMSKGLRALSRNTAVLLQEFIVHSVERLMLVIGFVLGLSALEVNMGPLLAMIGAAGFVIAFALQNTLSNFASGLMIMFYRPFDVGDVISVAGVTGVVKSMNLVGTTITTFDNKIMVVPNNSIWGNIITNVTGSEQRRVDFVFSIGYDDDVEKAKAVLKDVVSSHAAVLSEPAPLIKVNELADSSVNLICRPWTRTADYWTVYWDVMETVKARFDAAGISIPYPQQSVHFESPPIVSATEVPGAGAPSLAASG